MTRTRTRAIGVLGIAFLVAIGTLVSIPPAGAAVKVKVSVGSATVTEVDPPGPITMRVPISLDIPAPAAGATVYFSTGKTGDTAKPGIDYTKVPLTKITFPAGSKIQHVPVKILANNTIQGSRKFTVQLTTPGPTAVLQRSSGTGSILDDEATAAPLHALRIGDVSVVEGNTGNRVVNVEVAVDTPNPTTAVTFKARTVAGSATAADYVPFAAQPFSIAAGAYETVVPVTVKPDLLAEGDETFTVSLSAVTGSSLARAVGLVKLIDDDGVPAPVVNIPASPANGRNPVVTIHALPTSGVRIYKSNNCSGVAAVVAIMPNSGTATATISVTANAITPLSAKAFNSIGQISPCTNAGSYAEDSDPPAPATNLAVAPNDPYNNFNDPVVTGDAEADSLVDVFDNTGCSGSVIGTGTASALHLTGIAAHVADDTISDLSVQVRDSAGNRSACALASHYIEDSNPPAAPSGVATSPGSVSSATTILVHGMTETGATVEVFETADCTGAVAGSGTAATFAPAPVGAGGISIVVPANATTLISARATDVAGNVGACAQGTSYLNDSAPPEAPTNLFVSPESPAQSVNPVMTGTAEFGSTLFVYRSSDCTGAVLGFGSAADFATPGLTLTVATNSTNALSVHAYDAAGNAGDCADAGTYVEDELLPAAPSSLSTTPGSPANFNSPALRGAAEVGTTIRLFLNADCSGTQVASSSVATFGSTGFVLGVGDNSTTTWSVRAVDAALNVSSCTQGPTYVEDSTGPSAPSIDSTTPTLPLSGAEYQIQLIGSFSGDTTWIEIHQTPDCSDTPTAESSPVYFTAGFGGLSLLITPGTTYTFYARARDAANNPSACSSGVTVDDPALSGTDYVTVVTGADPASGSSQPVVSGTISPDVSGGMQIVLYIDNACTHIDFEGNGFVGSGGTWSATVFTGLGTPGIHTIRSRAIDTRTRQPAGPCSTPFSYQV